VLEARGRWIDCANITMRIVGGAGALGPVHK
jgi:hypothetical protein